MQRSNLRPSFAISHLKPARPMFVSRVFKEDSTASSMVHIALLSQIGAAGRILVGEWFGGNCSERISDGQLEWIPCVVSSGVSQNHSGALFKDLPANMLGCFLMGCLTSPLTLKTMYSEFTSKEDTALVKHASLLVGLRTGLCGSLTTFASWKLQMIQMLLAGHGTQLKSQWLGVATGLILGLVTSLSALLIGQHFALFLITQKDKRKHTSNPSTESKTSDMSVEKGSVILTLFALVVLVLGTALALIGVLELSGLNFWRKLCCSILLAPIGALLRWRLSSLNTTNTSRRESLLWLPIGTLLANLIASCISFLSQGVEVRWNEDLGSNVKLILYALRSGLAGSFSTVSTWVVEVSSNRVLIFKRLILDPNNDVGIFQDLKRVLVYLD